MRAAICTAVLVVLAHCVAAGAAPRIAVHPVKSAARPAVFDRIEWVIELDRTYRNPFDPSEIAVDAVFTAPDQKTIRLPAFWYQPFAKVKQPDGNGPMIPAGHAEWRLRFCAPQPGTWLLRVTARDSSGTGQSSVTSFTIDSGERTGFIRRSPSSPRYLQYDSGVPYFMVGLNLAWSGDAGLADYQTWFSQLGAAGGNFARIWMSYPNRPMETRAAGAGRYDLGNCWYYDRVLELAEQNGIVCMMAIGAAGDLFEGGYFNEGRWPANPYNAANGGPATRPVDLFTNPSLRVLYKRRLRYLIARYSAFTSMGFWEFWNEQDNAKGIINADWVREMAAYLKANDPYAHLVTTSYSQMGDPAVWNMADIDLTQRHIYGDEETMFDAVPFITNSTRAHDGYAKPHLVGEYGISWRGPDSRYDADGLGTNLHNALWAAAMSGGAGGACNWWWDSYVHPKKLFGQFTGLARFAAAVDWPRRRFTPLKVLSPSAAPGKTETLCDVVIPAALTWAKGDGAMSIVEPDGSVSGSVPGYLFGPEKQDMRVKTSLRVDLPVASRMVIRVLNVSDYATLRVFVDGKPTIDFPFSALPGAPDQETTKLFASSKNTYQATFNKDRTLELPAGRHVIGLDNIAGDWMSIGSITFTNARSSRYTGLRVLGLADNANGEILLWLHDPASHCGTDRAGTKPKVFHAATLSVPVARSGTYRADWWDTRKGEVLRSETTATQDGHLALIIPTFARDIALRVGPTASATTQASR